MRRCLWLVPVVLLLLHGPAEAKDDGFGWVVPGERLTWQSDLVVRSSEQAAKLATGSLFAYLKPWNADPFFDPILVGPIDVRHLDPEHRYLRVRISFEIPDVPSGSYALRLCTEGCVYSFDGVGPRLQVVASPPRTQTPEALEVTRLRVPFPHRSAAVGPSQ